MANKETSKTHRFQMEAGKPTSGEMQDQVVDQEAKEANIAPRDSGDLTSDDTPVESTVAGAGSQMTELAQSEESSHTSPVLKGDIHPSVESESTSESDNTPIESTKLANLDSQAIEQPLGSADTSAPEVDTQNSVLVPTEAQSSQDEARNTTGESEPLIDTPSAVDTQVSTLESLLQELLSKVSGLESLSEILPTKLQQIENRLIAIETNQHKEIEAPGSKSMLEEIEKLVQNACERAQVSLKDDERELNDYYNQLQHWKGLIKTLRGEIISATQVCYDRIKECGKVMKDFLPSRLDLQPRLQGRYEGLELIEKMLVRLQKPADALSDDEILDLQLPSVSKQELIDLLDVQMNVNEETAHQLIEKKLQDVGNLRYQSIRKVRDLAEELSKRWLNFIEKKVLPILDGIDDGERYSEPLVNELKNDNPKLEPQLAAWFQTYSDLRKTLIDALQKVGVQRMDVKTEEPINYNRHEPFDVQQDPKLPNESIKEVTRHGYEYKDYSESEFKVLRNAQVVVAKNPNIRS